MFPKPLLVEKFVNVLVDYFRLWGMPIPQGPIALKQLLIWVKGYCRNANQLYNAPLEKV
jgi:hypothetical protein